MGRLKSDMSEKWIPEDAIVSEIVSRLEKPEEYLGRVFDKLADCQKRFGSAHVFLSVSGTGVRPNYRIVPGPSPDIKIPQAAFSGKKVTRKDQNDFDFHLAFRTAYDGCSHERLELNDGTIGTENWSRRSMTFGEFVTFYREWSSLRPGRR